MINLKIKLKKNILKKGAFKLVKNGKYNSKEEPEIIFDQTKLAIFSLEFEFYASGIRRYDVLYLIICFQEKSPMFFIGSFKKFVKV